MSGIDEYSRKAIEKGSKSFAAAARLLDSESRDSAQMLYAWCRYCDDQIDSQHLGFAIDGDESATSETLESLRRDTHRSLAGEPVDNPAFIAFQRVVERHGIPERYPMELLEGFAMDAEGYHYRTLDDTLLYSYRVAGVVGVMMAYIMGVKDGDALQRACDLGIAFQLTNISRDVMDDARMERVYLPADWMEAAGVPPGGVMDPEHRSGVFSIVQRLLVEADRYYASALEGFPRLGWRAAWGMAMARYVYRHIGRLVVRRGSAAWDQRATVGRGRKLFGVCYGLLRSLHSSTVGRLRLPRRRDALWTRCFQEEV